MTLNITLDLGHKKELEAFARFCTDLANSSDEIIADIDARQMRLYGPQAQTARLAVPSETEQQGPQELDYSGEKLPVGETRDEQHNEADAPKATRERGKPSAGHARRTKAEIAEDDAAAKTGIEIISQTGVVAEEIPLISTGEERLSPEDTPEDAAADAADEAAETAATKTDKLTTEDVRNGMGIYVTKYGIEAIQLDGLEVFNRVLGPCPLKNEKGEVRTWRVSDLPDDQAVLKRIVDGFAEMTTKNPYGRTAKVA